MLNIVYDWTFSVWRVMCGDHFTDIKGFYSFESKDALKWHLKLCGLKLRGNQIVPAEETQSDLTM